MSGFLQFIFVLLIIYFAFRIIFKYFGGSIMRFVLRRIGRSVEKKYGNSNGFSHKSEKKSKRTILHKSSDYQPSNKAQGEYIDYEEID